MRYWIALAVLAATACSPDSEIADKDIDYAAINKAAGGPASKIVPEPIAFRDIEEHNLFGAGCNMPHTVEDRVLLIAQPGAAYFMLKGDLVTLAPNPGPSDMPYGIASHFDGRAHSLELRIEPGTEAIEGPELVTHDAAMTIRDTKERVVFEYSGRVQCGA